MDWSYGDRCLPDQSCGSVLVTEMVWIRPRGRVDSEMGIEIEIGGLERRSGAYDGCGVDGVLTLVLLGFDRERKKKKEKEEKKEETAKIRKKKERRKKRRYWKKKRVGKIILKKEYKNIIYIKYSVK